MRAVLENARQELVELIHYLHSRGWSPGTGGNFSRVLSREPFRLLMTPSGIDKGAVTPDQLLIVDREGQVLEGQMKPSAETLLHIPIIEELRAEVVLHTHSVWNTLASISEGREFAIAGFEMLKGLSGVTTHEHFEKIPILDNSQDMPTLATELRTQLKEPGVHAVLLRGHGMYTWGTNVFEARRHAEVLEFLFEVSLRSKSL